MNKPVNHYFLELRKALVFEQPRANRDMDMASVYRDIEGQGSVECLDLGKIDRQLPSLESST